MASTVQHAAEAGKVMPRIMVIAPQFPEYSLRYAGGLARHAEVFVRVDAAQLSEEYAGRRPPTDAVQHFRPARFRTPLDLLWLLLSVIRIRPHVIHLQEAAGPRKNFFNACVARLMKRRATIALTVHDPVPHTGRDQAAARRTAAIQRYVRRRADIVVLHGAYCEAVYRRAQPPRGQRIIASEVGVILTPATIAAPECHGLRLYFFGRMEAYKGLDVALRMAELLHRCGADIRLEIAGRGPELDRLQARLLALPLVTVRNGFVPPQQVIASIQASDCVILPYLNATQSAVLAAAFGGGRCVIASDVGGLADVVEPGYNGILVPPGDPQALADAALKLANDHDLLARLQAGARRTGETRLDWDRIAERLMVAFVESESSRMRR